MIKKIVAITIFLGAAAFIIFYWQTPQVETSTVSKSCEQLKEELDQADVYAATSKSGLPSVEAINLQRQFQEQCSGKK